MADVSKWWRETAADPPPPTGTEHLPRRLLEINAGRAIPIETVSGPPSPEPSATLPGRIDDPFLDEEHHRQYGQPWAMGKCIFEFVVSAGLLSRHRLLDFGCGALRFGHWAIRYLDAGNYFGIDAHLASLEAATTYELPLHGLEEKRPRLLWNNEFAVSYFGTTFDWIVDFSSASRVKPKERQAQAYANLAEVLAPGGHLLTSPLPRVPLEAFEEWGLTLVRSKVMQHCPLLEGHDSFKATKPWWEFVRA
jgi:SAM-dependent methyltransferase